PGGGLEDLEVDAAGHEAFHLVDVEALVDPGDQEGLDRLGVRADLPALALLHRVGLDDQGEYPPGGLDEGLRGGGPPPDHAHVGLDVEVVVARRHGAIPSARRPRSPQRACSSATATGPAVSVRSSRGPRPATRAPAARRASTSSSPSPPSGPTTTAARMGRAAGRTSASGAVSRSQRQTRTPARSCASRAASQSPSAAGAAPPGTPAGPHCLGA